MPQAARRPGAEPRGAGGELFDRICARGRLSEREARYFFQQLVAGTAYCHGQSVAHRDLKLENALLDGAEPPGLKLCDFGYSKSSALHSQAKSTVGTPAYIAPEVLRRQPYDGRGADVWSLGVLLYVMLVGTYPFEDAAKPNDFRATIAKILARDYAFPPTLPLSAEVRHLFDTIFQLDPAQRATLADIAAHPWFTAEPPPPPPGGARGEAAQSAEEVQRLVAAARVGPGGALAPVGLPGVAEGDSGGPAMEEDYSDLMGDA